MINLGRLRASAASKTHVVFATTALFFGVIFALAAPPFMGIDEDSHFSRVYQLAHGGFSAEHKGDQGGGNLSKTVSDLIAESKDIRKQRSKTTYQQLTEKAWRTPIVSEEVFRNSPGAASYNIIAYLPAVTGFLIGDGLNFGVAGTLLVSRLVTLITYVAIVSFALFVLRKYRLKWLVVAVALLPQVVFVAATVNADALAIALSILIFAIFSKSLFEKKLLRSEVATVFLAAILLPLVKFNYTFISLIVLLIPSAHIVASNVRVITSRGRARALKLVVVVIMLALSIGWVSSASWSIDVIRTAGIGPGGGTSSQQLQHIIDHPKTIIKVANNTLLSPVQEPQYDYMNNMVGGRLGFNNVALPAITTAGAFVVILLAGLYAREELTRYRKQYIKASILCLISAATIFATLYVSFTKVGGYIVTGVQGRYFIPLIPFIVAVIVSFTPIQIILKKKTLFWAVIGTAAVTLLISVYYYLKVTYGFGVL